MSHQTAAALAALTTTASISTAATFLPPSSAPTVHAFVVPRGGEASVSSNSNSTTTATATATTTTTTTQESADSNDAARKDEKPKEATTSQDIPGPKSKRKGRRKGGKKQKERDGTEKNGAESQPAEKDKEEASSSDEPRSSKRQIPPGSSTTSKQKPSTPKREEPPVNKAQEMLISDILQQDDFYDILGVKRSASSRDIQKAYRKRAVQTHPDKVAGNDRRAFDKVSEAYDVLSDDTKKQLYDRYGKRGLDPTFGGGASSAQDFFNFFTQNQQRPRQPRNRNIQYQLEVTLEQLYRGNTESILVEIAGGRRKRVEVRIGKGMMQGSTIVLSGENDVVPNATPGDIVFVIIERQHPTFRRKGHDLAVEVQIGLREALCGVTRQIQHLDGRILTVRSALVSNDSDNSAKGDKAEAAMIQTGDVHVLRGEGMPKSDSPNEYGDLFVQYRVSLPNSQSKSPLTTEEREQLGLLLEKLEGASEGSSLDLKNVKEEDIQYMTRALARDFGKDAPRRQRTSSRQQYFYNGSAGDFFGGGPFFGGNPFTGPADGDDDGSNVQCQQM